MDCLPQFIHVFIDLGARPFEALLAQIDGIRQKRATFLDAHRVAALGKLDALAFQKSAQVLIKFCFVDAFHN